MKMELVVAALIGLCFVRLFVYDHLEISPLKYGVLKAMASQSREVDRALEKLLENKPDLKICNKDFRIFEKVYLANLNMYIFQYKGVDSMTLRKKILKNREFQL
jgi:Holliday junction resolvasome RuvABC ATP-dependent DNA helicase subunit